MDGAKIGGIIAGGVLLVAVGRELLAKGNNGAPPNGGNGGNGGGTHIFPPNCQKFNWGVDCSTNGELDLVHFCSEPTPWRIISWDNVYIGQVFRYVLWWGGGAWWWHVWGWFNPKAVPEIATLRGALNKTLFDDPTYGIFCYHPADNYNEWDGRTLPTLEEVQAPPSLGLGFGCSDVDLGVVW